MAGTIRETDSKCKSLSLFYVISFDSDFLMVLNSFFGVNAQKRQRNGLIVRYW